MQRRHFTQAACVTALATALPSWAQTYPTKTVRLVVPFAAGGPTDSFARLYAQALSKQLGQTVFVENKPGASGTIGSLDVKNSPPDGYTLLFGTASTHALYNLIELKPRYDATQDFDYVAVLGGAPVAFGLAKGMPGSLKEFFELTKKSPDKYSYGSPGTGTLLHVATERLIQLSGAKITHIPYKGSAPAMQDLMGGTIHMAVGTVGGMLPLHNDGRLQLAGVATKERTTLAPDAPTVAESAGLAAPFSAVLWNVVAVARKTPDAVRAKLAEASKLAMADPALLTALGQQGMTADVHVGDTAATAYVKEEVAVWEPVVTKLGDAVRR
jgi:tripartite-type tricarboxylate transporter receptor subunit TctC